MSDVDTLTDCLPNNCVICLRAWDLLLLAALFSLSWLLLTQRTHPSPPAATQQPAQPATNVAVATAQHPIPTIDKPAFEPSRFISHTVPRRPRRTKKLIRPDLNLHFSEPDTDSEDGMRSIDYSANFHSLDTRRVSRSLRALRDKEDDMIMRQRCAEERKSSNSSSSNNPSFPISEHNSSDSLHEPCQPHSFLSDTLHNKCHILYDVFHSSEKSLESLDDEANHSYL